MFSRDELARSKERNEKQPRRRATGRLKKKKKEKIRNPRNITKMEGSFTRKIV